MDDTLELEPPVDDEALRADEEDDEEDDEAFGDEDVEEDVDPVVEMDFSPAPDVLGSEVPEEDPPSPEDEPFEPDPEPAEPDLVSERESVL